MKHAYLIIAHKHDLTLNTLLSMLDHENNHIFIHMDKKTKTFGEKEKNEIKHRLRQSKITFTERINVNWGGYSQINAELILLKTAIKTGRYDYYHLLSGEDLPIKNHEYMDDFFEKYKGTEFIYTEDLREDGNHCDHIRVRYYHWFQEKIGNDMTKYFLRFVRKFTIYIQKILHVHRNVGIDFRRGPNWFSITHSLANYIVEREGKIKEIFHDTLCCDELFLQTLVHNSKFENKVAEKHMGSLRYTDFKRGCPWVFRSHDYEELVNSSEYKLFARKFDAKIDTDIINKIYNTYS